MEKQTSIPDQARHLQKDCDDQIAAMETSIAQLKERFRGMRERLEWLQRWMVPIDPPPTVIEPQFIIIEDDEERKRQMSRSAKHPALGPIIEKVLAEHGMSKADFGRRIDTSRQNVSLILKKSHFDTQLLWKICDVLDTDLFGLISQSFDGGDPGQEIRTGTMNIHLELSDTKLVHITADLVRGILHDTH